LPVFAKPGKYSIREIIDSFNETISREEEAWDKSG
jgi:hypothetical protein